MSNKLSALLILFFFCSADTRGQGNNNVLFTIENKSPFNYTEKVIAIPWQQVLAKFPSIDTSNLKITDAVSKKEITYQLEYSGSDAVKNLLVQVNIRPKTSVKLLLQKGKPSLFITKTYGRYVPERKEDFAWENDKIAFRMYGKELEQTPKENAYGIDVWVKRTSRMILNERYKKGEYHVDHGDGLDYYHVGLTLGAGNIMPNVNDSIYYSRNYTAWKLLDNGPLRTSFQLSSDAWDVAGKKLTAVKTISLDAGAQLNKITVQYKYDGNEDLPVVVGIIKRPEQGAMLLNERQGILGYWEPQHGADGTTGVGCIIPAPVKNMQVSKNQLLAFAIAKKNEPFIYYTGAAWDKAGVITNEQQWFDHLQQMQQQFSKENLVIK
jgi:Domain of unknown function (DUF4861)